MTIVRNACGLDFKTTLFVCLPNANLRDFIVQYGPCHEAPRPKRPKVMRSIRR